MWLVPAAVVLGVAVGLLTGGSLAPLGETKVRWAALVFIALGAQLIADNWPFGTVSETVGFTIVLLSTAGIALFLVINRDHPGMLLAGLGIVLNLLVIGANRAMPVSAAAARAAGAGVPSGELGLKHEPMTEHTLLPWLGDVIPVPVLGRVLSLGDVLLGAGIFFFVYGTMHLAGRGRHRSVSRTSD